MFSAKPKFERLGVICSEDFDDQHSSPKPNFDKVECDLVVSPSGYKNLTRLPHLLPTIFNTSVSTSSTSLEQIQALAHLPKQQSVLICYPIWILSDNDFCSIHLLNSVVPSQDGETQRNTSRCPVQVPRPKPAPQGQSCHHSVIPTVTGSSSAVPMWQTAAVMLKELHKRLLRPLQSLSPRHPSSQHQQSTMPLEVSPQVRSLRSA